MAHPSRIDIRTLLIIACVTFAPIHASADFSKEELQKLNDGELVQRRQTKRLGDLKLTGGQSWLVVDRSPAQTWKLLANLNKFHKIVPGATSSNRVSSTKTSKRFELTHQSGPLEISYQLDFTFDGDQRAMKLRVVPEASPNLRDGWGFAKIRPWYDGRSLISFGALVDIGDGFLTGLIRPAVQHWLLRVPEDLKRYVEARVSK